MDKMIENNTLNHIININERKSIALTGIKSIESFDSNEFLLNSNLGQILLKGNNLEIIKLDTLEGVVSIKGTINSLEYADSIESEKKESLLTKLFKWV